MAKGDIKPQYDIVEADSVLDMRIQIKMAMEGGWLPQGGVHVVNGTYHQAMVRHMEECAASDI